MFLDFTMVEGDLFFVFDRLTSPEASTVVKHVISPGHGREDAGKMLEVAGKMLVGEMLTKV